MLLLMFGGLVVLAELCALSWHEARRNQRSLNDFELQDYCSREEQHEAADGMVTTVVPTPTPTGSEEGLESLAPLNTSEPPGSRVAEYQNKWHSHPRWSDLAFHADPDLLCRAHPELLTQLLDDLINSALKYSESGSQVTVQARRADHSVVSGDTRPWPRHCTRRRAFFGTTAARQSGVVGTGLGLSIVSRIARVLGGRVDCQSVLNQGSVFRVSLRTD